MYFYLKYLGMPWKAGENDCYHFCLKVWREQFGICALPEFPAENTQPKAARKAMAQIGQHYCKKINRPKEGDAVLMKQAKRISHIGIWIGEHQADKPRYSNENHSKPTGILHCTENTGVILTPQTRLHELGYEIDSYYRIII